VLHHVNGAVVGVGGVMVEGDEGSSTRHAGEEVFDVNTVGAVADD
jgi:hypothetical protein